MKELVVVSGKGGTGKTSVVASFASLADRAVIADCDVDAPNLKLVLAPTVKRSEPFVGGKRATIRDDRCTGCGRCFDACRFDAIVPAKELGGDGSYQVEQTACEGCGACAIVCPAAAVSFEDDLSGKWFVSDSRFGPFVHAQLGVGRGNSGKLVTQVRREARKLAEAARFDLVLVDGAPGIGCPVIASMTGADLVLMVTEPTLSGLHDLKRVAEVGRGLRVPGAVCINKWDLNPETAREIETWSNALELPVVGLVPYDDSVTRAQVAGLAVAESAGSAAGGAMRELWQRVRALLGT